MTNVLKPGLDTCLRRLAVGSAVVGIATAVAFSAVAETASQTSFEPKVSGETLMSELRTGGFVIFVRHATTEADYADQIAAKMGDCSTQRTLSEEGWHEARAIGAAFTVHRIPVGEVISSEYCRAWQTADLAFGRYEKNPALNFEPAEEYSDKQTAAMRDRVRPLLADSPPAGTNTVLVGHDDPFEAATGLYPEPMGVAFVVRPDGKGNFDLVSKVTPQDWF